MKKAFLTLVCVCVVVASYGDLAKDKSDACNRLLSDHLYAANQILLFAPDVVEGVKSGCLYINEEAIQSAENRAFMELTNGKTLNMPPRFVGKDGAYLVISRFPKVMHRISKLAIHCNDCGADWIGEATQRNCIICGSTNITIEVDLYWD